MRAMEQPTTESTDEQGNLTGFKTVTAYCETCDGELQGTPGELGERIHSQHIGHDVTFPGE